MEVIGYLNIYKSGHYHAAGKQGAFNRHGGDVYPTLEAARAAIEPVTHYVDTVPIRWTEEDNELPAHALTWVSP